MSLTQRSKHRSALDLKHMYTLKALDASLLQIKVLKTGQCFLLSKYLTHSILQFTKLIISLYLYDNIHNWKCRVLISIYFLRKLQLNARLNTIFLSILKCKPTKLLTSRIQGLHVFVLSSLRNCYAWYVTSVFNKSEIS